MDRRDRPDHAALAHVGRDGAHARQQLGLLDGVEHGEDQRAGERSAAEGAAQAPLAGDRRDRLGGQHGAGREAAGEPLRHRQHVGRDLVHLGREGPAGAAHPRLHLVEDQQGPGVAGQLARREQVVAPELDRAGHALDGLDEERGHVPSQQRAGQRVEVAARHDGDVEGRLREGVPLRGARGQRPGRGGPPVERALERHHPAAAGGAKSEAQRVLVRLGAAVDEEHLPEAGRGERQQVTRRLLPDRHRQHVALEHQRRGLVAQRREQVGMRVAEHRHGVPAPQVQHPAPSGVPEPHPLAAHRREGQLVVDRHQRRSRRRSGKRLGDHLFHPLVEPSALDHSQPVRSEPASPFRTNQGPHP